MVLNKTSLVKGVPLGKDLTAMTDSFLQSACYRTVQEKHIYQTY